MIRLLLLSIDVQHNTKEIEDEKAEITFSFKERKVDEFGRSFGVGRRKSSHARVALKEGSGQVTVNGKSVVEYFEFHQRKHALEALEYSETAGLYDVDCIVRGGGSTG